MTLSSPPEDDHGIPPARRRKLTLWAVLVVVVTGLHLGLFALLAVVRPDVLPVDSRVIDVILFRPPAPVPPPPPPVEEPAPQAGGGAPAAPSVVRTPPEPPPTPDPPPAPVAPAPEPSLIIGTAPTADPTPGMGQGGQGSGTGGGSGSGSGPGSGSSGPRFIRGPQRAEIEAARPSGVRGGGLVAIRCRIRPDTRLDQCRVVNERPARRGFGEAALGVAEAFRFQPPVENGVIVEDQTVTVTVDFPPR